MGTHKIEILRLLNGVWACDLYMIIEVDNMQEWSFVESVNADSWSQLTIEIGNKGFLDKLNQK